MIRGMDKPVEQERWEELDAVLREFEEDAEKTVVSAPPPEFFLHERPTERIPGEVLERLRKGAS